MKEGSEYSLTL